MFCLFTVDRNRTECVNKLRQVLMSVHQNEFLSLSKEVFSRKCDINDTICTDERNLFIDLVAKEGSHAAQKQLLDLILRQPNATEDDFRRILFHCIAIKDPASVSGFILFLIKHDYSCSKQDSVCH